MNKFGCVIAFAMGAAAGSAASWYFLKTKYERIAQEEIDSVKEVFSKRANRELDTDGDDEKLVTTNSYTEKPDINEYTKNIIGDEGYSEESETPDKPYVIPPEIFDTLDDYEVISLTYYVDHILADDDDNIIEDVEGAVGYESLTHFGEYEDDSVYVRNDVRKIDYEILLDNRPYETVVKNGFYTE